MKCLATQDAWHAHQRIEIVLLLICCVACGVFTSAIDMLCDFHVAA